MTTVLAAARHRQPRIARSRTPGPPHRVGGAADTRKRGEAATTYRLPARDQVLAQGSDKVVEHFMIVCSGRLVRRACTGGPGSRYASPRQPVGLQWATVVATHSGEADVQDEVTEPQFEYSAPGQVHDKRQQDDGQNDDHHPKEEHDDAGDGMPRYSSRSSHGRRATRRRATYSAPRSQDSSTIFRTIEPRLPRPVRAPMPN